MCWRLSHSGNELLGRLSSRCRQVANLVVGLCVIGIFPEEANTKNFRIFDRRRVDRQNIFDSLQSQHLSNEPILETGPGAHFGGLSFEGPAEAVLSQS